MDLRLARLCMPTIPETQKPTEGLSPLLPHRHLVRNHCVNVASNTAAGGMMECVLNASHLSTVPGGRISPTAGVTACVNNESH